MLPPHVGLVLLSATVPNVAEFADWVGRTKRKKIFVTGTLRRPVPLEHCVFASQQLYKVCEKETFLPQGYRQVALDRKAKDAAKAATKAAQGGAAAAAGAGRGGPAGRGAPAGRGRGGPGGGGGAALLVQHQRATGGGGGGDLRMGEKSMWLNLINHLKKKELLPAVVFAFSKRKCDASADALTGLDLTTSSEKAAIHRFCAAALARLSPADAAVPQVRRVRDLLQRGLGVHHAGLLPLVKEIVEHLFCRGLTKVLFSTETFAMGVNAPARAVAFASLRKHDGRDFRSLLPGEYTQMAGRAGRRGLDPVGTVVIMCGPEDEPPDEGDLRRLLTGKATRLESQFRLTYGMILNLMRVEDLRVEDMLRRSFAEFHAQRALAGKRAALAAAESAAARVAALAAEAAAEDADGWAAAVAGAAAATELAASAAAVGAAALASRGAAAALVPGRLLLALLPPPAELQSPAVLLRVAPDGTGGKLYVVLVPWRGPPPAGSAAEQADTVVAAAPVAPEAPAAAPMMRVLSRKDDDGDMFALTSSKKGGGGGSGVVLGSDATPGRLPQGLPWCGEAGGRRYAVLALPLSRVLALCRGKLPASAVDAEAALERRDAAATARALAALADAGTAQQEGLTPLDPVKDLRLADVAAVDAYRGLQARLASLPPPDATSSSSSRAAEWAALAGVLAKATSRVETARHAASDAALEALPDYHARQAVLKAMGYVDPELGTVTLKGRVACEINTAVRETCTCLMPACCVPDAMQCGAG